MDIFGFCKKGPETNINAKTTIPIIYHNYSFQCLLKRCLSSSGNWLDNSALILGRLHTDSLLGKDVNKEGVNLPALQWRDSGLVILVSSNVLNVEVEEVGRVHWSSLSFWVELGGEDRASLVDHTLVGAVVEVDEVLLELRWKGCGIDGVTVVLGSNVALTGCKVKSWDVVSTVTVLELDGASTCCKSEKLVTETDSKDWNLGGLHETGKVVNSLLAMSWVTRTVGDEDSIEVMGNLVNWEVIWEDSYAGPTTDQAAKNVLLNTAVNDSYVHVAALRADVERSLGADSLDQVDLFWVNESLILISVVFLSNGDSGQRRTLLSQISDNSTGINPRNGWDTLASTPLTQTLDSSPVGVLSSVVGDDDTSTLDVWRFEVLEKTMLVAVAGWNTVVSDQWLSENQDLTTVRRIGHRLWVPDERGGKDGFTRNVGLGSKRLSVENWPILQTLLVILPFSTNHSDSYPDREGGSVERNRSSSSSLGWHLTSSTSLHSGHKSCLLGNLETCWLKSRSLGESGSKHVVW